MKKKRNGNFLYTNYCNFSILGEQNCRIACAYSFHEIIKIITRVFATSLLGVFLAGRYCTELNLKK